MNGKDSLQHLKEIAQRVHQPYRLQGADAMAISENPLCGDEVLIELKIEGKTITDVGYSVNGCLLCKAASALLIELMKGGSCHEVQTTHDRLEAMLQGRAESCLKPFKIFEQICNHSARHGCVMLPFQATLTALKQQ
ncbi:MAG: iron-sulfur cluster assembly scaffold protein [Arenicella sp.]